jgi:hypothetical protein
MNRMHRLLIAAVPPMLAAAVLGLLPGRARADDVSAPRTPTTERGRISRRVQSLGSQENPIPVAGTETRGLVLGSGSSDRIAIHLGSLPGWLMGTPGFVLSHGGGPDPMGDVTLPMQLNVFTGGAIETALWRSSGLWLEGGRVLLRDPIDILGWGGGSSSEYWTSSAGFAVRF